MFLVKLFLCTGICMCFHLSVRSSSLPVHRSALPAPLLIAGSAYPPISGSELTTIPLLFEGNAA